MNARPDLYNLVSANKNHWISIRPLGVASNRSGIGVRVRCKVGDTVLLDEVRSGGSYYSQNQLRVHFGLGTTTQVDLLEILWPSGQKDRYENVPSDQILFAVEGEGLRKQREK